MSSGIYVLENTINGKSYVGQSKIDVVHRMNRHRWGKNLIEKAITKYGYEKFKKYIYYVPEHLLDTFEIGMIKKCNSLSHDKGYNISTGGSNPFSGYKHSNITKARISATEKGRVSPMKGKKHSPETKAKMSVSGKGRISSMKGKKHSLKTKEMMRQINNKRYENIEERKAQSIRMKEWWRLRKEKENGDR